MKTEREFLHDLASPLAIACGMMDIIQVTMSEGSELDEKTKSRVEKTIKALDRMTELLKERRAQCKQREIAESA